MQAPKQSVLITELYFPDEPANRRDALFRRELMMSIAETPKCLAARFDFVLNMR
jgi:protocatechuate 3,4-dioxygenase beta subunit